MIHFHGGVINERRGHDDFTDILGRHFCVSFAYPDRLELYHQIGQSVMLDNGAFSLWRQGKTVNWQAFYEWCEPWLEHWTTWAVIPDVINDGTKDSVEEENERLLEEWPFGHRGAPVWHFDESLERLDRLITDGWPLLCLGSAKQYEPLGAEKWRWRMEQVMDVACDERGVPRTRLHLLRGLQFGGGPYPLYSADSATAARVRGGSPQAGVPKRDLLRVLNEVDSRQTPRRWVRREQGDLFNGFVTGAAALEQHRESRREPLGEAPTDERALF